MYKGEGAPNYPYYSLGLLVTSILIVYYYKEAHNPIATPASSWELSGCRDSINPIFSGF